jgi:SsrA-binding protein
LSGCSKETSRQLGWFERVGDQGHWGGQPTGGIEPAGPPRLRDSRHRVALQDSYARIVDGEAWLYGVHVPPYAQATGFGAHDPDRRRKLLLHRRQIDEWMGLTQQQSLTMVPLSIYFKDGKAKVELALARGRHHYDKRRAIAARDAGREAAREARTASRAGHR